jgi:hypothetical protein
MSGFRSPYTIRIANQMQALRDNVSNEPQSEFRILRTLAQTPML